MRPRSLLAVAFVLGLARAQDNPAGRQQLRGNDGANTVLARVDDVLEKELQVLGAELDADGDGARFKMEGGVKCVDPATGKKKNKNTCGANALCCVGGLNDATQGYGKDKNCGGAKTAAETLALAKAATISPVDQAVTVDSIQGCCHTGGTKPDEPAHFSIFMGVHRDCVTGNPLAPSPALPLPAPVGSVDDLTDASPAPV